jgi:hypothetical protein
VLARVYLRDRLDLVHQLFEIHDSSLVKRSAVTIRAYLSQPPPLLGVGNGNGLGSGRGWMISLLFPMLLVSCSARALIAAALSAVDCWVGLRRTD